MRLSGSTLTSQLLPIYTYAYRHLLNIRYDSQDFDENEDMQKFKSVTEKVG